VKNGQILDPSAGTQLLPTAVVDAPRNYGRLHALGFELRDGETANVTLDQVRLALAA
jgi:hypothetical protein